MLNKYISAISWFFTISAAVMIVLSIFLSSSTEIFDGLINVFENTSQQMQTENENGEDEVENEEEIETATTQQVVYIGKKNHGISTDESSSADIGGIYYSGILELPVNGATGFAAVGLNLVNSDSEIIGNITAGTAFLILIESGEWWYISVNIDNVQTEGWVQHIYCMINLPDIAPSIIYDNTNAYNSAFVSSRESIPGITGTRLYSFSDRPDGKIFNPRLHRYEFIVPVLYSTANKIVQAQRSALENGESIIMYEAFRPITAQMAVVNALSEFANANPHIMAGVATPPWSIAWFINTGVSSHQLGYAVDVGLAKVLATEELKTGEYKHRFISQYETYNMPSAIHELSIRSIAVVSPRSTELSEGMINSPPALDLRSYLVDAGFTPLASEWWHFDDMHTARSMTYSTGNFEVRYIFSIPPSVN